MNESEILDKPIEKLTLQEFADFFTSQGFELQLPHKRYAFKAVSDDLKAIISHNDLSLYLFRDIHTPWFKIVEEPTTPRHVLQIVNGLEQALKLSHNLES